MAHLVILISLAQDLRGSLCCQRTTAILYLSGSVRTHGGFLFLFICVDDPSMELISTIERSTVNILWCYEALEHYIYIVFIFLDKVEFVNTIKLLALFNNSSSHWKVNMDACIFQCNRIYFWRCLDALCSFLSGREVANYFAIQ